jgi:hypothetical protein
VRVVLSHDPDAGTFTGGGTRPVVIMGERASTPKQLARLRLLLEGARRDWSYSGQGASGLLEVERAVHRRRG